VAAVLDYVENSDKHSGLSGTIAHQDRRTTKMTHSTHLVAAISKATQDFVTQVHDLTREAVTSTIASVMGSGPPAAVASAPRGRRVSGSAKGAKRAPEDLERLSAMFADFVKKNPGRRIEQINRELGTNTHDLALPIRKLIASGALTTQGEKRSTTYFAKEAKGKSAKPAKTKAAKSTKPAKTKAAKSTKPAKTKAAKSKTSKAGAADKPSESPTEGI
jgi:hypothetical protein